jgi:putative colanic acid biosysnthesis UDP-glucose lipid carrier transferase
MKNRFRHHEHPILTFHRIWDALAGVALFLALSLFYEMYQEIYLVAALLILLMVLVSFRAVGIYEPWRGISLRDEARQILRGCTGVYVMLLAIGFSLKLSETFSRRVFITWMIAWPLLLIAERLVMRTSLSRLRRNGGTMQHSVIAGAGELGGRLARSLEANPWVRSLISGYFDDEKQESPTGHPVLGDLSSLPDYVRKYSVDMVYLALPLSAQIKIDWLLRELADSTASVSLVPDIFFNELILGGSVTYVQNLPLIALRDTPFKGINFLLKRLEDLVLATILLILASPIMLASALAIKLTSLGPIFFQQWRYGLNGHAIKVYKFRTMKVCEDGYCFSQATRGDPRVTCIGAFLRRTSLDELPQLINVLQGRMSLVGPRPHPVALNEEYRKLVPGYMLRHKVKPGITGLAQVNGLRGETDTVDKMKKRVELDLQYLQRWSVFLDLKIICQTIWKNAWRTNAY